MGSSYYLKIAVLAMMAAYCMIFLTSQSMAGSVPSVQNMSPLNQTAYQHLAQKLSSSDVTNIEIVATLTPDNLQIPETPQMSIVNTSGQPTESSLTPEIVNISGMLSFVILTSGMDLGNSVSNGVACITLPVNWATNRVDISLGTGGGNGYNSFYLVEVLLINECDTIGTLQWELRTDSGYNQEIEDITLSSNVSERYLLTDLISLGPLHNASIGGQPIPGETGKLTFRLTNNWKGSSNLTSFGFKHFRVYRISIGPSPDTSLPTGTLEPKPGIDTTLPTGTIEPKSGTDTTLPTGTLKPKPGTDTTLPTGTAQPVPVGSDKKGGVFIPETDTEVETQFESGDTGQPVWTGTQEPKSGTGTIVPTDTSEEGVVAIPTFIKPEEDEDVTPSEGTSITLKRGVLEQPRSGQQSGVSTPENQLGARKTANEAVTKDEVGQVTQRKSVYEQMELDKKKRKEERKLEAIQKEREALEKRKVKLQKREAEKARQEAVNKQREADKAMRKADRKQKALDTLVTEDKEQLAKVRQSAQSAKNEATAKQAEADRAKAYSERLQKTVEKIQKLESKNRDTKIITKPVPKEKEGKK